jgi:fibronectin type 3 domain-containing protein
MLVELHYFYDVYREENNSGIFSVIGQTTITTFDDINVVDGNGYAYKIRMI